MSMQNESLVAPNVPVAEADGLIKIKNLINDIEVQFPVWDYSEAGDTYQLMLNGTPTGVVKSLPAPPMKPGALLMLSIEAETMLLESGTYTVGYRSRNTLGGTSADSMTTHIRVDFDAPGAGMLAALTFPYTASCRYLTGLVPGYAGIAAGDVIQTRCNDVNGPAHIVTLHETRDVIKIAFARDFLDSLNTQTIKIDYVITDRAGNTSINSQPVWVTLQV